MPEECTYREVSLTSYRRARMRLRLRVRVCASACTRTRARACVCMRVCLSILSCFILVTLPHFGTKLPHFGRGNPRIETHSGTAFCRQICLSTAYPPGCPPCYPPMKKKEKLRTSCLLLAFPEEESPKGRGREGAYKKPPAPQALPFRCRRKSDVTRRLIFPRRRSLLYSKRAQEREPRKPRRLGSPSGGPPPVTGTSGRAAKPGQVMLHPDHTQKGRSPWQNARMSRQSSPSP